MKKRPVQVTVIAWFLMVTCALSVVTTLVMIGNPMAQEMMAKSPLPIWVQYLFIGVGLVIGFVSGFFMLKGKRLARSIYVSWGAFSFAVNLATSPLKRAMIPSCFVFAVIVVLLFLPNANAYFADAPAAKNENGL